MIERKSLPVSEFFASVTTIYGTKAHEGDSDFSFDTRRWEELLGFYRKYPEDYAIVEELKNQLIKYGSFNEPIKLSSFDKEELNGLNPGEVIFYVANGTHRSAAYYLAWKEYPEFIKEVNFVLDYKEEILTCCGKHYDTHLYYDTNVCVSPNDVIDADFLMDCLMHSSPLNGSWWETDVVSFNSSKNEAIVSWKVCDTEPKRFDHTHVEKLLKERLTSADPNLSIKMESYILDENFDPVVKL